jgi:hypothetical protein
MARSLGRGIWIAALLLAGCGGRTTPGWMVTDGGRDPDVRGKLDVGRRDGRRKDVYRPLDKRSPDSCLPIPASQIAGGYTGAWSGTWYCGSTAELIKGDLKLNLQPAGGPSSFAVEGALSGTVDPGFPISGSVSGKMVCTSFSGSIPDLIVGSGGLIYKLTGTLYGVYAAQTGVWSGFKNGTWKATDPSTSCYATGTWSATR